MQYIIALVIIVASYAILSLIAVTTMNDAMLRRYIYSSARALRNVILLLLLIALINA